MLQSYYRRNDPSVGAMVKYDEQVRQEIKRLSKTLATVKIDDGGEGRGPSDATVVDAAVAAESGERAATPAWDVFSSRRKSSVLVFQNSQMEQSE